jgi:hypothetical protein
MSHDALNDAVAHCETEDDKSPYASLAAELYRERVIRARQMPLKQKILAGQRLFEAACQITLLGIRNQNPSASEEDCRKILRERLAWRRRHERKA